MKFSKVIYLIFAVFCTILGVSLSVFSVMNILLVTPPQDPFFWIVGVILFLIPSIYIAIRGILYIYNTYKNRINVDSEDIQKSIDEISEQPEQKKANSSLKIGNIFAGGLGIIFLLLCLYVYLVGSGQKKYFLEKEAKTHVVSILQKTAMARDYYKEYGRFSSAYNYQTEKIVFNGMEYEVSFRIENNMIDIVFGEGAFGEESYNITLVPKDEGTGIIWDCTGGSLPYEYRPPGCQ